MIFYYFSVTHQHRTISTVWEVSDIKAVRFGIEDPENTKNCSCSIKPGQLAVDAIGDLLNSIGYGNYSYWPLTLRPGQFYPRIARPSDQHAHESPGSCPGAVNDRHGIAMALGQLNVLTRQLTDICQTIHPTQETLSTYGHAIRNLLILACTEVEAHWRGVLVANGYKKDRYKTSDYVMLLEAMRLDAYSIEFPYYPWLGSRQPFKGWASKAPTQSLNWYDAYNAVKHDREESFPRATLENAFDAVSACAIMLLAQYGHNVFGWHDSDSGRFFNIKDRPSWSPSAIYTLDYKNLREGKQSWKPVDYCFSP